MRWALMRLFFEWPVRLRRFREGSSCSALVAMAVEVVLKPHAWRGLSLSYFAVLLAALAAAHQ
jgi:hypothetical protein